MGTRSLIVKLTAPDRIRAIYCHWDGYPGHVGRILLEHYPEAKLDQMLDLGDLSALGPEIGEKHPFGEPPEGVCDFYGRDREEEGVEARNGPLAELGLMARECNAVYVYLFRDGKWEFSRKVTGHGLQFRPLTATECKED
jgi:hypothetical protein